MGIEIGIEAEADTEVDLNVYPFYLTMAKSASHICTYVPYITIMHIPAKKKMKKMKKERKKEGKKERKGLAI
jgi:hypothetical protein